MPQRRPLVPPTGFYDPALDAQRRAAGTGLGYLQQDTELAGARAAQDYGFGVEDLTRGRDRGFADLLQTEQRGQADLLREERYGTEDHDRAIAGLTRSYQQLGRRQAEGARAAGVLSGGLALKAAAIRSANQAIDREPIDSNLTRLKEDVGSRWTRLGEDVGSQWTRLGEDFSTASGRMAVDFGRGTFDRDTALRRAGEQNTAFGLDLDAQRMFQATQAGWIPPKQPGAAGGPAGAFAHSQQQAAAAAAAAEAEARARRARLGPGFRNSFVGGR